MRKGKSYFYQRSFLIGSLGQEFIDQYFSPYSYDSFEGEPDEKRRKTTNVVIDQPATEHKVLIDNVPDNTSLLEEVRGWIKKLSARNHMTNTISNQN